MEELGKAHVKKMVKDAPDLDPHWAALDYRY